MKTALIGLPMAGKKTLFELLTGRHVPESRKPGELIEGIAKIRDPRVDTLAALCKPERTVYAENRFTLLPDANLGGESRDWLEAARKCDLVCFVVGAYADASGAFEDSRQTRTALEGELLLADMEIVEKRLIRIGKEKRAGQTAEQVMEEHTLQKCMKAMEDGQRLADVALEPHELASIRSLSLLTLIPMICTFNVAEDQIGRDFGPGTLTVSAKIEQEIMTIENPAERKEYLASLGLASSGVDRMNAASYDALGLMSFYTIGEDEVRAWTIRKGSTAPTAGGKVHTDIERGFIRVEIIKYDDLVAAGSEKAAKGAGKVQMKGRDYVIADGDICHFLFNV